MWPLKVACAIVSPHLYHFYYCIYTSVVVPTTAAAALLTFGISVTEFLVTIAKSKVWHGILNKNKHLALSSVFFIQGGNFPIPTPRCLHPIPSFRGFPSAAYQTVPTLVSPTIADFSLPNSKYNAECFPFIIINHFYMPLFTSIRQTHCASHIFGACWVILEFP